MHFANDTQFIALLSFAPFCLFLALYLLLAPCVHLPQCTGIQAFGAKYLHEIAIISLLNRHIFEISFPSSFVILFFFALRFLLISSIFAFHSNSYMHIYVYSEQFICENFHFYQILTKITKRNSIQLELKSSDIEKFVLLGLFFFALHTILW